MPGLLPRTRCSLPGHGTRCEVAQEREAQDKQAHDEARAKVEAEIAAEDAGN